MYDESVNSYQVFTCLEIHTEFEIMYILSAEHEIKNTGIISNLKTDALNNSPFRMNSANISGYSLS